MINSPGADVYLRIYLYPMSHLLIVLVKYKYYPQVTRVPNQATWHMNQTSLVATATCSNHYWSTKNHVDG